GILFLALAFLPTTFATAPLPRSPAAAASPHPRGVALGLSMLMFCGVGGIQRFYVGKTGTGILWLLTFGLLGVGQLIDVILICTGRFTDARGRELRYWDLPVNPATTM